MKKILKIAGTTTLAIAMALSLTGCGTKTASKPNQIVVWGLVDEDVFNPIIKDFKSQNKGVEVVYYKKTLDASYENNALNSILSGQGPDVWAIPNDWVYRHKDKLTSAPDALLTGSKIVPKDYFVPNVLADSAFDNKIYAMAPTTDVLHVYYNQRLFDQGQERARLALKNNNDEKTRINKIFSNFPVTWEDFDSIIPWLTVKSGNNISVAGAAIGTSNNVSHSADILDLLMLQNQTKMVSDDLSQSAFNLPVKNAAGADVYAGKNSLDFYTKYSDPASAQYTWNGSMANDVDTFANEKVAMIFSYTDLSNYFAQIYPKFTFKRALAPQIGNLNPIVDYSKYSTYVVPEQSANSNLAWQFVISLATVEANTYKSATKEVSSKKPSGTSETLLKNRDAANAPNQDTIKSIVTWNKGRYPSEIDFQFKQAIDRANSHAQDTQTSLDTAASNVTELLRKTTW